MIERSAFKKSLKGFHLNEFEIIKGQIKDFIVIEQKNKMNKLQERNYLNSSLLFESNDGLFFK